jgi:hypothetical protein
VAQTNTFVEEAIAAGYGVFGLIRGDREAGSRFNLTTQGITGSFIALLSIVFVLCTIPLLFEVQGFALHSLAAMALTFVLQLACAFASLAQAKRLDGLTAYLVADNWSAFYVNIIALTLLLMGFDGGLLSVVLDVITLVLAMNIARHLIGLVGWQIATFVIAQLVSQLAAELLVPILLPLPDLSAVSS